MARRQFTVSFTCSNCGAQGAAVWEEAIDRDRPRGLERRLVSVHGTFHAEGGRTQSGDPLIVCNACDEILPD